jgi:hypothetical protein
MSRIRIDQYHTLRQSRRYRTDQEFSESRSNKAHRFTVTLSKRKNWRRFHQVRIRFHSRSDSRRSDQDFISRQVQSVSISTESEIKHFFLVFLFDTEDFYDFNETFISNFRSSFTSYIIYHQREMSISHALSERKRKFSFICKISKSVFWNFDLRT